MKIFIKLKSFKLFKEFILTLIFSILLSGCYTTQDYMESPDNFLSGKSDVKPDDKYKIDSLLLWSNQKIRLDNYLTKFTECMHDTCGKFVYKNMALVADTARMLELHSKTILYKNFPADTLNIKGISKLYLSKEKFNYPVAVFVGFVSVLAIGLLFFYPGWILRLIMPHGVG